MRILLDGDGARRARTHAACAGARARAGDTTSCAHARVDAVRAPLPRAAEFDLQSATANALSYALLHVPRNEISTLLPRLQAMGPGTAAALLGLINERVASKFRVGMLILRVWSRGGGDPLHLLHSAAGLVKSYARLLQLCEQMLTPGPGSEAVSEKDLDEMLDLAASGLWALGSALQERPDGGRGAVAGAGHSPHSRERRSTTDDEECEPSGRVLYLAVDGGGTETVARWDHSSTEVLRALLHKHPSTVMTTFGIIATMVRAKRRRE